MRTGWQTKQLGELCDVLDHKRKPITKHDRVAGEYPYYGATGVVDYVADYLFDEPLVLVGEDGAKWGVGESTAFAVNGKVWVNNHAHVLRPNREVVLDDWLIYYLTHLDITEFVSGLTVPKLNQGSLREIPITLPPLTEQQRIVGILDGAFEGIATAKANAEKNVENARAVFDSELDGVFARRGRNWSERRLGELADFKNGLNFSQGSSGQSVRIVGVGDFQDHHIVPLTALSSVTIDGALGESYELRKDDILTVRSNGSKELVGRCMLVPELEGVVSYSGFIIRIRCNSEVVDPTFLLYFLKSSATRSRLTSGGGGANINNINQEKLSSLIVPLPPMAVQGEVVEKFGRAYEATHHLEDVYQRKVEALDALKKSLLHEAFAGQL